MAPAVPAQITGDTTRMEEAERRAEEALAAEDEPADDDNAADESGLLPVEAPSVNLLWLLGQGGWFMIPIGLMSLLVVVFGIERAIGLRRRKVIPPELIEGFGELAVRPGGLDPKAAYRFCQRHPSTAANVFRSVLLKVGRPHAELEHTVKEASEREAEKLYGNVRPLNLAAAISPLLGLLGTVWGMIQAFFATANMGPNVNKGQALADGIYVALVTTFAGLSVAIPAVLLAHFFEGRIQRLFREIDEMLLGVLPQLERFEGKLRVTRHDIERDEVTRADGRAAPEPAPAAVD
jgi:biopolymer transport protein ExbB